MIGQPLDAYEKHAIAETLKLTNGNREEAARILCIGARTLYRKLEKYELASSRLNCGLRSLVLMSKKSIILSQLLATNGSGLTKFER